ncbi:unnamed protein product [Polarella glacialis]|uniref:Uncharacterized protein n=1 Tax=Polarella glacialis TaxID=89957 RepID=A0A813H0W6_POLGL|nr:unnamed protein product [Polarella glacialis]
MIWLFLVCFNNSVNNKVGLHNQSFCYLASDCNHEQQQQQTRINHLNLAAQATNGRDDVVRSSLHERRPALHGRGLDLLKVSCFYCFFFKQCCYLLLFVCF